MIQFRKIWCSTYRLLFVLIIGAAATVITCQAVNPPFVIKHLGDGQSIVQIDEQRKYLLLPVEEASPEAKLYMIADNDVVRSMNVRLAINKIDYFVPVDMTGFKNKQLSFNFQLIADSALCWDEIKLSDEFDSFNREVFRPVYHFTPAYGWMNDPNGMVYKDGIYHLFYQYNPYGSMWGNMHWGHATTKDLVNWEHQPEAIVPDALGTIFSGSCVVDKDNTAGFGAGAIIAFYTSAGERQVQSMAYSLDNGKTFKKYARNPILTSTQRDFRDPKVFWHNDTHKWVMILAVGQEMQIYSSPNLKDWTYESCFGEGQGAHGGVWECPDLIELPIENTELKKWVLICNLNPGGPFGGSATQYFVGDFDGKTFVNDSPKKTKWMDWGKDHYATVTWSNAPEGRHIALAWMSNWQYANEVPTKQFRSANSVPRDLSLYTSEGETYVKVVPSPELLNMRDKGTKKRTFKVDRTYNLDKLLNDNTGTYEIEMTIQNKNADVIGMQLFNSKGEEVDLYYNMVEKQFTMDRTKSGNVAFSKEFPAVTVAPVDGTNEMTLRIFVDKSSLEIFGNGGRFVMTNLVFPSEPYNRISFYAKGGSYAVTSFTVYKLSVK
ncbi:GH32 C-terminal domain-containing protein [uncultured Bacteroides sp.]|uniref:GH32 C-terminal domain-containing protein n=1 Tax=uncultured Bacteroides sp. TaxID=162156 RepID=UPI0025F17053|nr:GH32 C-terminal domain-containing protein [uncultured Bacteroides sp.]